MVLTISTIVLWVKWMDKTRQLFSSCKSKLKHFENEKSSALGLLSLHYSRGLVVANTVWFSCSLIFLYANFKIE